MSGGRREFLRRAGGLVVAGALAPRSLVAAPRAAPAAPRPTSGMADPTALTAAALDSARQAGAGYADVRLTLERRRSFGPVQLPPSESEHFGIGVRALVNGYWGFSSSPLWTVEEAARLGRESVAQAKANAIGKDRVVELGTVPSATGEWTAPFRVDPFALADGEVRDWLSGLELYGLEMGLGVNMGAVFGFQQRVFASSEGASCTQTVRTTSAFAIANLRGRLSWRLPGLTTAQGGWETIRDAPVRPTMERIKAAMEEHIRLPVKPVEVGRFPVLVDAAAMGVLLRDTIGYATELDRAFGYEVNDGGSSYLDDPLAMLGSFKVGAPLLTVTAERSRPGSLATTRWDDEGVVPEEFTLVQDGELVDFQTTRESAAWLSSYYRKRGVTPRSHGCANAPSALDVAMQHTPNLTLRPGTADVGYGELLAGMSDGIAVEGLQLFMDWQHASGAATSADGRVYEVKRGKRVAILDRPAFLFRSTELWRDLAALGGAKSLRWVAGGASTKGEPAQSTSYTLGVVPGVFKNVTVIDPSRKA